MNIPEKELKYYLGKNYNKMKIPQIIKILNDKGIPVTGKMTLEQLFEMVREYYARKNRESTP